MSLFRSDLRPPAILSDEAVEPYVDALRAHLEPDPLFRRRLRGEVMNRYVATREGSLTERAVPRRMGRLGRAVLYASFVLALGVSGVMAASQETVPGDALYVLKRHIESLRTEIVPAHLQHDLAAYMLAERIQELGTVADRGDWNAVAALAPEIEDSWAAVSAGLGSPQGTAGAPYLRSLHRLVTQLPSAARAELGLALATTSALSGGQDGWDRAAGRAGGAGAQATSGGDTRAERDGAQTAGSGKVDEARSNVGGNDERAHSAGGSNVGNDEGGQDHGGSNVGNNEGGNNEGGNGRVGSADVTAPPGTAGGRAPTGPVSGPGGHGPTGHPSAQPSRAPSSTPRPGPRVNEGREAPAMPAPRATPRSGPSSND